MVRIVCFKLSSILSFSILLDRDNDIFGAPSIRVYWYLEIIVSNNQGRTQGGGGL